MKQLGRLLAIAALVVSYPSLAFAGMPTVSFSDIAAMRLEAISFFLICFLACSWLIQGIWNALRHDFPRLPRLSYARATGLIALWGLLFLLVLSMISGARELMTPGAWRKEGLTYKLPDDPSATKSSATANDTDRRHALDKLRAALWTYAQQHEGKLPLDNASPEIPSEMWIVPESGGMKYIYKSGLAPNQGAKALAYEPGIFGDERMVLLTSGEIVTLSEEMLGTGPAKRQP